MDTCEYLITFNYSCMIGIFILVGLICTVCNVGLMRYIFNGYITWQYVLVYRA
jgi:TRAP-type C4-dicarboxylate transport system permease small subunit